MDDYDRARGVLKLYQACERACASPNSIRPTGMPATHSEAEMTAMWQWKVDVSWVLRRVGYVGAKILAARLLRQQHSQANGWLTIAREVGLTKEETEIYFDASLAIFIRELDLRKIPDVYWLAPQLDYNNMSERCAAREIGEACPAG